MDRLWRTAKTITESIDQRKPSRSWLLVVVPQCSTVLCSTVQYSTSNRGNCLSLSAQLSEQLCDRQAAWLAWLGSSQQISHHTHTHSTRTTNDNQPAHVHRAHTTRTFDQPASSILRQSTQAQTYKPHSNSSSSSSSRGDHRGQPQRRTHERTTVPPANEHKASRATRTDCHTRLPPHSAAHRISATQSQHLSASSRSVSQSVSVLLTVLCCCRCCCC